MTKGDRTRTATRGERSVKTAANDLKAPPERWQHAERSHVSLENGAVRVERVGTGVDALVADGRLEAQHDAAARRWRKSYESAFGVGRGTSLTLDRLRVDTSYAASDGGMSSRLDAITSYRSAGLAVGRMGDALLVLSVGEGLSMSRIEAVIGGVASALSSDLQAIACRLGKLDRKALAGALVITLDRLAEHYDAVERRAGDRA